MRRISRVFFWDRKLFNSTTIFSSLFWTKTPKIQNGFINFEAPIWDHQRPERNEKSILAWEKKVALSIIKDMASVDPRRKWTMLEPVLLRGDNKKSGVREQKWLGFLDCFVSALSSKWWRTVGLNGFFNIKKVFWTWDKYLILTFLQKIFKKNTNQIKNIFKRIKHFCLTF